MSTVSEAKIAANRANAQASTGPKSPEGKARSALNALKHGLTSARPVIRPDERDVFRALKAALFDEVQPDTALELLLFDQLLHAAWNLRRIRRLEAELFDGEHDPLTDPALEARLNTLARYYARAERTFYRALKELRALKADRLAGRFAVADLDRLLAHLTRGPRITKRTHNPSPEEPLEGLLGLDRRPESDWLARQRAESAPHEAVRPPLPT